MVTVMSLVLLSSLLLTAAQLLAKRVHCQGSKFRATAHVQQKRYVS